MRIAFGSTSGRLTHDVAREPLADGPVACDVEGGGRAALERQLATGPRAERHDGAASSRRTREPARSASSRAADREPARLPRYSGPWASTRQGRRAGIPRRQLGCAGATSSPARRRPFPGPERLHDAAAERRLSTLEKGLRRREASHASRASTPPPAALGRRGLGASGDAAGDRRSFYPASRSHAPRLRRRRAAHRRSRVSPTYTARLYAPTPRRYQRSRTRRRARTGRGQRCIRSGPPTAAIRPARSPAGVAQRRRAAGERREHTVQTPSTTAHPHRAPAVPVQRDPRRLDEPVGGHELRRSSCRKPRDREPRAADDREQRDDAAGRRARSSRRSAGGRARSRAPRTAAARPRSARSSSATCRPGG